MIIDTAAEHMNDIWRCRGVTAAALTALLVVAGSAVVATPALASSTIVYVGSAADSAAFTTDKDPERTSTAFSITGTLVDNDGRPVADQSLSVSLDPSPQMLLAAETDENAPGGLMLSQVRTGDDGSFRLPVPALRNIDQYLDQDGLATLLFMSLDGTTDVVYRQYVELPVDAGDKAESAIGVSAEDTEDVKPGDTVADDDLTSLKLAASPNVSPVESVGAKASAVSPGNECTRAWGTTPWGSYQWRKEGSAIRKWVPVQRSQTGSKTNMTYEWSNTSETFVQVAMNYAYKAVTVAEGYTKSVNKGSGVDFDEGYDVVRDLEVEFDFYSYGLYCSLSGDATKWRAANVHEIRPYAFKGFNRDTTYRSYYTCPNRSYRGQLSSTLWVSRSSTTTFSGGVSVGGIGVDAKQTNTSSHKKSYVPKVSGAYICGQNGNPTSTEKVSETS